MRLKWVPDESDSSACQYRPPRLKRTFRINKLLTDSVQEGLSSSTASSSGTTKIQEPPTTPSSSSFPTSAFPRTPSPPPSTEPLLDDSPVSAESAGGAGQVSDDLDPFFVDEFDPEKQAPYLQTERIVENVRDADHSTIHSSSSASASFPSPETDQAPIIRTPMERMQFFPIVQSKKLYNPYSNSIRVKFNQLEFSYYQHLSRDPTLSPIIDHLWEWALPQYYPVMVAPLNIVVNSMLPAYLRNRSNLHAVIALCAFQLSIADDSFGAVAVRHKIDSNLHLRHMLARGYDTSQFDFLAALLLQLAMHSVDCRLSEWKVHMDLARQFICPLLFSPSSTDVQKYYGARMAKYDTFSCISTGRQPILRIENFANKAFEDEMTFAWGCPSTLPVLCSELSSFACYLFTQQTITHSDFSRIHIFAQYLQKFLPLGYADSGNVEELVASIWKISSVLYYGFVSLSYFNVEGVESMNTALRLGLHNLRIFPIRHIRAYILSTPLFILGMMVRDPHDQQFIKGILSDIYYHQKQPNFEVISEYCQVIWEFRERNNGNFTHRDLLNLRESQHWVSLII